MRESDVAAAQIELSRGGERCTYCGGLFPAFQPIVVGTSLDSVYGYIGGFFHPHEWLKINYSPENERILTMNDDLLRQLGIPTVNIYKPPDRGVAPWVMTHKQLVNLDVVIITFEPIVTKYGDGLLAECVVEGKMQKVLFGAQVLCDELRKHKSELPLAVRVIHDRAYYEFTAPKNL